MPSFRPCLPTARRRHWNSSPPGRLTASSRSRRVLRFPAADATSERGIGSHTDYGLLVIAAQDDVGGLYIRPPVPGEARGRNWLPGESTAGRYENDEPWTFVAPVPAVFTVFPGDIMQFITGGTLLATPHKVRLGRSGAVHPGRHP